MEQTESSSVSIEVTWDGEKLFGWNQNGRVFIVDEPEQLATIKLRLEEAAHLIDRFVMGGERNRAFFAANPGYMVPKAAMAVERP